MAAGEAAGPWDSALLFLLDLSKPWLPFVSQGKSFGLEFLLALQG